MKHTVETVTGPIEADLLGKTLIHEHFVFGYPGFHGDDSLGGFDEQDALETGITIALQLMSFGVDTVVDPTPNECGRNPELLKEISERTGLQIVCATGFYYEGEGATPYFKFRQGLGTAEEEIYEMFKKEITEGIRNTGIKPGIIKLASSKGVITEYERMFFKAAARVQREEGTVILTHTQEGTMGPEQVELLMEFGCDPKKIVIGHMCGNTDTDYHLKVLEKGAFIAFDRFGIQGMVGAPTDDERIKTLLKLVTHGYTDQIMLSHDTVNHWMGRPLILPEVIQEKMKNWHPAHLFENIIPELRKQGMPEENIRTMLEINPSKLFFHQEAKINS
ncbi:phosphotriesterase family protein [Peribacillus frigoritolerans]|uniref:phosphotriesterase family protein n=1 Tax=Peribacillus frigoritolerans TaxID=450367 RepID=UPI00105A7B6C|nr:phosphotriesterase-related protein [Peribacillus frigoritolerans]TDL80030.1 phosphotriesterase-related protein [Peribacillus frigoritolerans]